MCFNVFVSDEVIHLLTRYLLTLIYYFYFYLRYKLTILLLCTVFVTPTIPVNDCTKYF